MPVFVDTNVLVYTRDASDRRKHEQAREWIRLLWMNRQGRLSFQVLEEYYVTVTRKLRPGLPREDARADVQDLLAWRPIPVDVAVVQAAWSLEERFGISFWDSLVVAGARESGCRSLLSEDLQHEADYDGVVVFDPFRTPAGTIE